ncbi:MAG: von Willebrand factor type A domain-containing protein [Chitinophagaceae bacterium]
MRKIITLGLLVLALTALAFFKSQAYKISGTITDETGAPVMGASVVVKGTSNGVATDSAGRFTIEVADPKTAVLLISAIGLEQKQLKVWKTKTWAIAMKKSNNALSEVVVIGYGKSKNYKIRGASSYASPNAMGGSGLSSPNVSWGDFAQDEMKVRDALDDKDQTTVADREGYDHITENRFKRTTDNPLSTFSIDVDAASYSNVRRYLQNGSLPPAGAVRIEELVNYFHYDYPQPVATDPFSINTEIADCPWNKEHKLALIGLQGKKIATQNLPASNLVFLIDVSGSMDEPNKLPLVKASLKLLVEQLRQQDFVSLVVYAGAAGIVLPPTSGADKMKIVNALDNLNAGGSTAGGEGIKLAYKTAKENFMKDGNNRVILCTDGDFNVGVSSDDQLETMIEEERKSNVFLSVLGFGMGNYQDAKMQKLADKGNGNHSYIDGLSEARKVFVSEFGGTLFTIAKDVKLQVEFNPARVQGYRLIGYENRMLKKEDFNNDKKDAGELGSGHTVTALYEIIPVGIDDHFLEPVDKLKYAQSGAAISGGDEMMTIKFRYKEPADTVSKLIVHAVKEDKKWYGTASDNFLFAAAVAQFGLLLRHSEFKKDASWNSVLALASAAKGADTEGYRAEFISMIGNAKALAKSTSEPVGEDDDGGE